MTHDYYSYYAVTESYQDPQNPYRIIHIAHTERIHECSNLASALKGYTHITATPTMKKAETIANAWNDAYMKNGTYPTNDDWESLNTYKRLTLDELNRIPR